MFLLQVMHILCCMYQDNFFELTVITKQLVDNILHHLEVYGHNPSRIN